MAERRMFAKTIIDSDAFLEMPQEAQLLYFYIGVNARDKGNVNNMQSICKMIGVDTKYIDTLKNYDFIYPNMDGTYTIADWYENNGVGETARKRNNYTYRKWRECVLSRDKYTCTLCGNTGIPLNAHHIKPWAKYKDLRFDVSNGVTLCVKCHKMQHSKKEI